MAEPRARIRLSRSNIVRRGRWNTTLQEEGAGMLSGAVEDQTGTGAGSAAPTVELPDYRDTVEAQADAHPAEFATHCTDHDWLDILIPVLQALDERVGWCFRPERNDYAKDAITYYHGLLPPVEDSPDVYVVDVIGSSCSVDAHAAWTNVTTPAARRQWRENRI